MSFKRILITAGCVLWVGIVLACGGAGNPTGPREQVSPAQASSPNSPANQTEAPINADLPPHRFSRSKRPGQTLSQMRVGLSGNEWPDDKLRSLAATLTERYDAPSCLVHFFSTPELLDDPWDGTGAIHAEHRRSFIGHVVVRRTDAGTFSTTTPYRPLPEPIEPVPTTQPEEPPKVVEPTPEELAAEREEAAAGKLRLAKQLRERGKRIALNWLRDIVEEYPGTAAAEEAAKLLKLPLPKERE